MKNQKRSLHINPNPKIDAKYSHFAKIDVINELNKCRNGFEGLIYFIDNYIYVRNKIPQNMMNHKQFKHLQTEDDAIKLKLYEKQKEILYNIYHYRLNAIYKSRQTGISTITKAFILHYAIFNNNKEIIIVSKNEAEAIKFLDDIYFMYNNLPFFLRRVYSKAVTKSFQLGEINQCTTISVLTSTTKSGRSFTATILVLDECEFIEKVDVLQGAIQPTLSSTGGKAILISTPYEYDSQFYNIIHNENSFIKSSIHQSEIPGRDLEQYEAQCKELNYDKLRIQTELDMEQIIPYQRYFHDKYFDITMSYMKSEYPLEYQPEQNTSIFKDFTNNVNYFFGIDPYEGGNDYNCGIIIDEFNNICVLFKTKRTDIKPLIIKLCEKYNTKCLVERNRGFQLIKEFINDNIADKYLLKTKNNKNKLETNYGYYLKDNRNEVLSYISIQLEEIYKNNIENKSKIKIPYDLFEELKHFVIKKNKVEGLIHDDLIFALGCALYIKNNLSFFYTKKEQKVTKITRKKTLKFYQLYQKALFASNISSIKNKKLSINELETLEKILNNSVKA